MQADPPVSRPRSRFARPAANREFTNRDGPIAHFDRARVDLPPSSHRILAFYGVGGQGKTALRRHLLQRLADEKPRCHRFGTLDFHEAPFREPARGLLELRRRLRESGSIRMPIFDVAITRFWERTYPGEDLTRALGDLLGDSDGILGDLGESARDGLDVAEDIPFGVGQGVKLVERARRWFKTRGALRACDALRGLEQLEAEQIADRLPWFLGLDLQAHRDTHPDTAAPVIFLDTYEALWSDRPDKTGIAALETDAWVRELVAATPGTLFVVLGRERLSWHKRFPDQWTGLLDDQHLLGGLAEADADRFLRSIPIDDPAVRRAIIDGASAEDVPNLPPGARGAHPFYLDLAVDTWLDLRAEGIDRTPDAFGRTHPEVLARFLRHRSDAERAALKVLAGPAAFDRPLFAALLDGFRIPFPLTAFDEFCGLSIIEPGADGRWRIHELMREHLLADLDPALRKDLTTFLFDWFDARCQPAGPSDIEPEHEMALREVIAHRETANAETALDWLWQRAWVFYAAARYTLLEPLYRWAVALAEDRLGPNHSATATAINNLALLLQATNRPTEAEPLFRRALAINEASFGAAHPEVATGLNNLATLLQATNRLAQAELLYRRALAINEVRFGAKHPRVAVALNNLAQLLQDTNRLAEAEPLMRRALAIDEVSFGAEHPNVSRDLNNLAQLLKDTNRPAEAEPLMRRALAIDEVSFGVEHPDVANSLINLAALLKDTNRLVEAEPLMRRALPINEATFGAEHPNVATDLNNLAQLLKATNRLAEAEPLYRRALAIDEASFGVEHPKVATRLNNLALLLKATNRFAEAEPLYRRALAINETSFGAEHPAVATNLNNLATLLKDTNRPAEAEPLIRRALAIDEASFGAEHPTVATDLNTLALLLKDTNRPTEAEPLYRRALAISETSFGAEHPDVATNLNNLATLLKDTNRPSDAEPLSRRMLVILLAFTRDTGHRHPHLQVGFANYCSLIYTLASDPFDFRRRLDSLGAHADLEEAFWQSLLAELLSGL